MTATLLGALLIIAANSTTPVPASFHGTEAFFDFRKSGHELLAEKLNDFDHDGVMEALIVEQCEAGIGVSLWKAEPTGDFKLVGRSERAPASSLVTFEPFQLGSTDQAYLLDVAEESPDEGDHWVRLFLPAASGPQQIFSARYQIQHSEEDAGRTPFTVVDLGELPVGLVQDPITAGWQTLRVRHDPKRLLITNRSRDIQVVLGMRERVYQPREGVYREVEDRYLDYTPAVAPTKITTSSEKAVRGVAAFSADGTIPTAWIEEKPGPGIGESLTLTFPRLVPVRLIRFIPGCAASAKDWTQHNRIQSVDLTFDDGVNLSSVGEQESPPDPRVEGAFEVTVPGREYAGQKLIVLKKPIPTSRLTLTIKTITKGTGSANETCLAEFSAHEAGSFNPSAPQQQK